MSYTYSDRQNQQQNQQDYQTVNIIRDDDNFSIYSDININDHDQYYTNSIYSDEKNKKEEEEEEKEKVINDIISFYINESDISELIPLPISPENLEKLKNQWGKENKFSMSVKEKKEYSKKTIWKRISDSFKKQSSPKK